jgi:hypothetical protein
MIPNKVALTRLGSNRLSIRAGALTFTHGVCLDCHLAFVVAALQNGSSDFAAMSLSRRRLPTNPRCYFRYPSAHASTALPTIIR